MQSFVFRHFNQQTLNFEQRSCCSLQLSIDLPAFIETVNVKWKYVQVWQIKILFTKSHNYSYLIIWLLYDGIWVAGKPTVTKDQELCLFSPVKWINVETGAKVLVELVWCCGRSFYSLYFETKTAVLTFKCYSILLVRDICVDGMLLWLGLGDMDKIKQIFFFISQYW